MQSRPEMLRRLNERRIINEIRVQTSLSRAELARRLQLAMPTVSRIVDHLLEEGWLREVGQGDSSGGRPPVLVEVNSEGPIAIGVGMQRQRVRIVFVNLLGHIRKRYDFPLSSITSPDLLVGLLKKIMEENIFESSRILGLGIAVPGSLDATNSVLLNPTRFPGAWVGVNIVSLIQQQLQVTVRLENDANAAALAESWFGFNSAVRDTLFVLYEGGLGAGVVIAGSVYHGMHHAAGEFSHTLVSIGNGPRCDVCGRVGCLNAMTSPYLIEERVYRLRERQPGESIDNIMEQAAAGNEPDKTVVERALEFVSTGIANLLQVLDCAEVVLGGELFLHHPHFTDGVVQRVRELGYKDVPMMTTGFGVDAVAVGASALILQDVYNPMTLVMAD